MLADSGGASFTDEMLEESLQRSLDEYSNFRPLEAENVLDLPGDGWEVALNSLAGLQRVTAVYWPYDTSLEEDDQEDNRVSHWFLWWDDGQPVVTLVTKDSSMPATDDELRIWYEKAHTIEGWGDGDATTVLDQHWSMLVAGAAGFSAMTMAAQMMLDVDADMYATTLMATWGRAKEREFRYLIKQLAMHVGKTGQQRQAWAMDKWDRSY